MVRSSFHKFEHVGGGGLLRGSLYGEGPGSCMGTPCEQNDRHPGLKTLSSCNFVGGW